MTTLWSTAEFAEHEFPTPSYLVAPIIPQGGTCILHGKPNVGKSQFILTLAHAINNGLPLFGRWPTRQGPVVVVQVDMTGQIQQSRVLRVVGQLALDQTYWLVEEDGSTPLIDICKMPYTHPHVVEQIAEIDPLLIVWDTLRKTHMLSENASESAILVYNAARAVHRQATHMFVHHDRKEARDPEHSERSGHRLSVLLSASTRLVLLPIRRRSPSPSSWTWTLCFYYLRGIVIQKLSVHPWRVASPLMVRLAGS